MANVDISTKFYVYAHRRRTDNTIFYIGKGCGQRAWQKLGRSSYWNRISSKHGCIVEILKSGLSEPEALNLEVQLIAKHKSSICNLTDGGETSSGYRFTDEAKAKISAANKGKRRTPEQREKLKRLFNDERHKERLRLAVNTPEVKAAKAAANRRNKGKPPTGNRLAVLVKMNSEECRKKAEITRSSPEFKAMMAKKISEATKGKVFAKHILDAAFKANAKPFRCVETGITFDSISQAREWLKSNGWPKAKSSPMISAARRAHGYTQAYGYHWEYA